MSRLRCVDDASTSVLCGFLSTLSYTPVNGTNALARTDENQVVGKKSATRNEGPLAGLTVRVQSGSRLNCKASAMCSAVMCSVRARSAIVRATFMIRWQLRAESWKR